MYFLFDCILSGKYRNYYPKFAWTPCTYKGSKAIRIIKSSNRTALALIFIVMFP